MDIVDSVILGIIEGFTEFLPISSTGHLIVASKLLGIEQNSINKAYEVIIQLAAILAVIFNYKEYFSINKISLWIKIVISFLPIGIVGFLFSKDIKALFSVEIVAWMFIVGGVIFLIVERFYKEENKIDDIEQIDIKQAFYIGVAQIFALIPGTSRAGSTIIGAMLVGMSRKSSAIYSFLLGFIVMCATSSYDFLKHYDEFNDVNLLNLFIGFITAFIVAFLTMKLFISFLQKFTFNLFGIYRIIFGFILLVSF